MTPDEAEALAARIIAAMDAAYLRFCSECGHDQDDDRERVASDLAGLRLHSPTSPEGWCTRCGYSEQWCDAARYADNLRRTAALYDVRTTATEGESA